MPIKLIWDNKCTASDGRSTSARITLPFQTVETVNESARERQLSLDFFARSHESDWRNRLIWGDKKYILPSLLPEFSGKVDLVYIDPPFDTGADFSFTRSIPDSNESFVKEPNIIEQKAYRDTWGRGLDGYLQWFYETAVVLHDLLSDTGSIYVHLDWRLDQFVRCVMDEVFGPECFRNLIVWKRDIAGKGAKRASRQWPRNIDSILFYSRSADTWTFKQQFVALSDEQKKAYRYMDADGRLYKAVQLGDYSATSIARFESEGLIHTSSTGSKYKKYYLDEAMATVDCIWTDIPGFGTRTAASEQVDYPTQKPEALLERIINTSSNEGDLVLDCFCGSGTTATVAEKLGRRWITCDLGRFAIQTTRKRLLSIDNVRPFAVQNLGKYERQAWQAAEFTSAAADAERQRVYRRFMLDLYHAEPLEGYAWLHGLKNGRSVHVGAVDAPVTVEDVKAIARECWRAAGRGGRVGLGTGRLEAGGPSGYGDGSQSPGGYDDGRDGSGGHDGPRETANAADVLGWDFAFEVNETAKAIAAEANVRLAFKRIPREVLEKKAVEQGDIRFFELAALSLNVHCKGRAVTVALRDFIMSPDDVPADVQAAITHWSQWIDYWAVDWDFKDDTFHNQWQSYRTKRSPKLQSEVAHTYDEPGAYTVVVKVIDILGNDTTKSVVVEVT